jgi:hypothetical protein
MWEEFLDLANQGHTGPLAQEARSQLWKDPRGVIRHYV